MARPRPPLSRFPRLVREWHPTKNGDLRPSDVTAGSERRIVWRCSKDPSHEWEAQADSRARGHGCPFCSGRRATREACITVTDRAIAREWHPTKNGTLRPRDVRRWSTQKVWWKCPRGPDHEWRAEVRARAAKNGRCPYCEGRALSAASSLARVAPAIAAQWHPTKNGKMTADLEIATAWKMRWWRCSEGKDHVWRERTYTRVARKRGCPFCANHRISATNSVAVLLPSLAREWHPTKNGTLRPRDVVPGSNERVFWKCPRGPDHEWQTTVANRAVTKSRCPFCTGKRVSITNSLASCAPAVAAQWHEKKNGTLTPKDVHSGSGLRVWWRCVVGHEWQTRISHRTRSGSGCPTCEILYRRGRAPRMRRTRRVVVRLPGD